VAHTAARPEAAARAAPSAAAERRAAWAWGSAAAAQHTARLKMGPKVADKAEANPDGATLHRAARAPSPEPRRRGPTPMRGTTFKLPASARAQPASAIIIGPGVHVPLLIAT
jgi:hypothetical protein